MMVSAVKKEWVKINVNEDLFEEVPMQWKPEGRRQRELGQGIREEFS